MPYIPRQKTPGLIYHVTARGNNQQPVFQSEHDYDQFLRVLRYIKCRQPFELYGYCLMTNHVHLLLRPSQMGDLSKIMHVLLRTYAKHYNERYDRRDHLWRTRFRSRVIRDELHAFRTFAYVDLNPVRAGMCTIAEEYPWSSARAHILGLSDPLLETYPPFANQVTCRMYRSFLQVMRSDEDNMMELSTGVS